MTLCILSKSECECILRIIFSCRKEMFFNQLEGMFTNGYFAQTLIIVVKCEALHNKRLQCRVFVWVQVI